MEKILAVCLFIWSIFCPVVASAQEKADTQPSPKDEEVIAVLEVLELMEILEDVALFKDLEYLNEGDPNDSQK